MNRKMKRVKVAREERKILEKIFRKVCLTISRLQSMYCVNWNNWSKHLTTSWNTRLEAAKHKWRKRHSFACSTRFVKVCILKVGFLQYGLKTREEKKEKVYVCMQNDQWSERHFLTLWYNCFRLISTVISYTPSV